MRRFHIVTGKMKRVQTLQKLPTHLCFQFFSARGDHAKLNTCLESYLRNREGEDEIKDSSSVMSDFDERTRSQKPVLANADTSGVTNGL